MKRPVLHALFWFVYIIQDTLLHYTWMSPKGDVSAGREWFMAFETALVLLPPKLLIVYYLTEFGVERILNEKYSRVKLIVEIGILLIGSVILFRVIFFYIVHQRLYNAPVTTNLFTVRNLLISALEMGYITGIAFAFKLLRIQTKARAREENLVREKLQTELKFLRSQTNPHFLFNTLNNIYALARKKSDLTPEVVLKLSELLSFMLYESKKETISISDEIRMLEDYIGLEKIRYDNRLSLQFHKSIDNPSQPIAPLLLLPLVENAFKHGVGESRFDSIVNIDLRLLNGNIRFFIENTMENEKMKTVNGSIGLSNIRRQLELMYKEHNVMVENDQHKFKVTVSINLNSYGKV